MAMAMAMGMGIEKGIEKGIEMGMEVEMEVEMETASIGSSERHGNRAHRRGTPRKHLARLCAAGAAAAILAVASAAPADEYESTRSGHPLRILAYVVHPIGVILDTLIFRPFHWIGSHEPFKTLTGHQD